MMSRYLGIFLIETENCDILAIKQVFQVEDKWDQNTRGYFSLGQLVIKGFEHSDDLKRCPLGRLKVHWLQEVFEFLINLVVYLIRMI